MLGRISLIRGKQKHHELTDFHLSMRDPGHGGGPSGIPLRLWWRKGPGLSVCLDILTAGSHVERVSRVPFSLCSTTSGGPSVHVLGHCEGAKAWFVWHGDLLCGGIFSFVERGNKSR